MRAKKGFVSTTLSYMFQTAFTIYARFNVQQEAPIPGFPVIF